MLSVSVERGTGAGCRRPFLGRPQPWECGCVWVMKRTSVGLATELVANAEPVVRPGYLARCPDCGMTRPCP